MITIKYNFPISRNESEDFEYEVDLSDYKEDVYDGDYARKAEVLKEWYKTFGTKYKLALIQDAKKYYGIDNIDFSNLSYKTDDEQDFIDSEFDVVDDEFLFNLDEEEIKDYYEDLAYEAFSDNKFWKEEHDPLYSSYVIK